MLDYLSGLNPVVAALLAGGLTWFLTAAGAATVLFFRNVPQAVLDAMLGFAGGVMLAASYWSLLAPAIEHAADGPVPEWVPPAIGFIGGGAFLALLDKWIPHLHPLAEPEEAEGPETGWHKTRLLVLAITLHNIPEGLAVGVAFGAVGSVPSATIGAAAALAVGIAIQNVPEGVAVAMPLRREGFGVGRSFMYGQASAVVEPIAAVLGAAFVGWVEPALPYALSFAAGAMVFVVVEEVVPESQRSGNADLATSALIAGFVVMMILDVALG